MIAERSRICFFSVSCEVFEAILKFKSSPIGLTKLSFLKKWDKRRTYM